MKNKKLYKCGEKCPRSGQYQAVGSRLEITMIEGKVFPPSANGKNVYKLTDETKHKKGRK